MKSESVLLYFARNIEVGLFNDQFARVELFDEIVGIELSNQFMRVEESNVFCRNFVLINMFTSIIYLIFFF